MTAKAVLYGGKIYDLLSIHYNPPRTTQGGSFLVYGHINEEGRLDDYIGTRGESTDYWLPLNADAQIEAELAFADVVTDAIRRGALIPSSLVRPEVTDE